jgi:hypothetical protein
MKLWKIVDKGELCALEKDGKLTSDGRRINRNFRAAVPSGNLIRISESDCD